jgi:hypothetical protein
MSGSSSFAVDMIDRAYNRKSWHGTNLRGSLRGLTCSEAARRPAADRHNIWELAVHCAYWKYVVTRRLTGMKRGSFPLEGSNFFPRPVKGGMTDRAWKADLALLDEAHRALRAAVAAMPPAAFEDESGDAASAAFLVQGAAAHDLYHAGQIQLIKKII